MVTNFLWSANGAGQTANSGLLVGAVNLMTTELELLAPAASIISSVGGTSGVYSVTQTGQGIWAWLFLSLGNPANTTAMSNGANFCGWFAQSYDGGTTFECANSTVTTTPARAPDFIIPLPNTAIANTQPPFASSGPVLLPALEFKVIVQNNTGITTMNGGTTVPYLKAAIQAMQY